MTIAGTIGNDKIEGTPGNDVISGDAGNDLIYGNGGNDLICGDAGNDFIQTFAGNDRLDGGDGDDQLVGGDGDDEVNGGPNTPVGDTAVFLNASKGVSVLLGDGVATGAGTDRLIGIEGAFGSRHDDTLIGSTADESFIPSDGNDTVRGGGGFDVLLFSKSVNVNLAQGRATGEGTDTISQIPAVVGSDANDTIVGDAGFNFLAGAAGTDVMSGGGGRDVLVGDFEGEPPFGNDQLRGGTGDDVLVGVGGNDLLDGGPGMQDQAAYWYAKGVSVNLAAGTATGGGEGRDTLRGVEGIYGSPGADSIVGSNGPNLLAGQAGNDTISGGRADDFLDGGAGNDGVNGGSGSDYCLGGESPKSCEIRGVAFAIAGAAADRGQLDYGEKPTCTTAAVGKRSIARRRRRHVAAASPPDRVTPPARKHIAAGGLLSRLGLGRTLVTAAGENDVSWQPTLYRFDTRGHRWRAYKRLPALKATVSGSGIALWTAANGRSAAQVTTSVPAGRYAWRVTTTFGNDTVRQDTLEPHVNYGTRARGLFQQACRF